MRLRRLYCFRVAFHGPAASTCRVIRRGAGEVHKLTRYHKGSADCATESFSSLLAPRDLRRVCAGCTASELFLLPRRPSRAAQAEPGRAGRAEPRWPSRAAQAEVPAAVTCRVIRRGAGGVHRLTIYHKGSADRAAEALSSPLASCDSQGVYAGCTASGWLFMCQQLPHAG